MNDLEFEKESKKMTVMIPDSVPMTRADGVALENRLRSEMLEIKTALRLEMGEMKSELRQEMGEMKSELRQEMGEMKSELRQEMIQLESRLMRYIHDQGWKMMGFQVATTGLMLSAFKFLH
jgi:ElaB/YqjD/DUF883 family membrane-anchored ribosome-binding protein